MKDNTASHPPRPTGRGFTLARPIGRGFTLARLTAAVNQP